MSDVSDALDALLSHPGWIVFREHVGEEWGSKAYAQRLKAAVQHARAHGADAGHAIETVDAANDAIAEMMRWPGEEVQRVKRMEQEQKPVVSRGGYR